MELDNKFELLSKCEDELICFVCDEWCNSPVRLNKCGHYFCSACLPADEKSCPKCKEQYFQEDVTNVHWYNEVREEVTFFKSSLEVIKTIIEKRQPNSIPETVHIPQEDFPFRISFTDPRSFSKNAKGESKLHIACKRKDLDNVKHLLSQNVDINSKDYACWTPLHEAIQAGSVEIVEELLANGAIIDSPGESYVTPLHKAVMEENAEIIRILVENGADTEALDFCGKKPRDCTLQRDILEILKTTKVKEHIEKPRVFLVNKVVVYCHSIQASYRERLLALKNLKVLNTFDITNKELTHILVKKTHDLSFKILLSMLSGVIIDTQEWLDNFEKGFLKLPSKPVLENNPRLSEGIRRALINHLMNRPKLFDGIKFYIENSVDGSRIYNLRLTKKFLQTLISAGGGVNLLRPPAPRTAESINYPYHAHPESSVFKCCNIIIFNDTNPPKLQYHMKELQHKSCKWIIDCVINFKLM